MPPLPGIEGSSAPVRPPTRSRIVTAMTAPAGLSEEEIAEILAIKKVMVGDLDWSEKPSNSNFLMATFTLFDEQGASIPGLTVDICVRRGRYQEDCRYEFGVFKLKGGKRLRAYQINVRARDKVSHNSEEGPWFGAHQHYGDKAIKFDPELAITCGHHEGWFTEFLKRANIGHGGKYVPPPLQQDLFDQ